MMKMMLLLGMTTVPGLIGVAHGAYFEMRDAAKIYYEDQGSGQPIVFVHGWTCSSKFWQKNISELSKGFRVIAIDLRGHGNSSKILSGHTIDQYARDIREVIEGLGLRDVVLAGWSLGGPVVLSYYQQYGNDCRLKSLCLVDADPFPFSDADWNSHSLRNYNASAMNDLLRTYAADPPAFATAFTKNMFKDSRASASDLDWMPAELTKTPPWIAVAAYSDYIMSDYTKVLSSIDIPVILFAADSPIFKRGIHMGGAIAAQIPNATFVPFEDAGHLLFYEQPNKFNRAMADFVNGLK